MIATLLDGKDREIGTTTISTTVIKVRESDDGRFQIELPDLVFVVSKKAKGPFRATVGGIMFNVIEVPAEVTKLDRGTTLHVVGARVVMSQCETVEV